MDNLQRLVFLLLLTFATTASAWTSYDAIKAYRGINNQTGQYSNPFSTGQQACSYYGGSYITDPYGDGEWSWDGGYQCYKNGTYKTAVSPIWTCPYPGPDTGWPTTVDGVHLDGGKCWMIDCPAGQERNPVTQVCQSACTQGQEHNPATGVCQIICPAPNYINPISQTCETPPDCKPPESYDGFGNCRIKECTASQVLNYSTGQCQTPPICAAYEELDNATNQCKLKKLNCPEHSHPNFSNDQCLADPKLTCPTGQHDDGTYKCVADDANACPSNTTKGYIDGIPQCIPKPHLDTMQKKYADAAAAAKTAKETAAASQAAADADPTNQALQDQAAADNSTYLDMQTTTEDLSKKFSDATMKSIADNTRENTESNQKSNELLQGILGVTTESLNRDKGKTASPGSGDCTVAPSCSGDAIQCALLTQAWQSRCQNNFGTIPATEPTPTQEITLTPPSPGGSSSGSCPAPNVINIHGHSLSLTYQPACDLATAIKPLIIAFAWLASIYIVFGATKRE